jgi:glycosyltransferase involved in cell wall biosynthesis
MTKPTLIIFSTRKLTSGIRTYSDTLIFTARELELKTIQVRSISCIFKLSIAWPLIHSFLEPREYIVLTWGIYNCLPFRRSNHISVVHGHPSAQAQGVLISTLLFLMLSWLKFRKKIVIAVSSLTSALLYDICGIKANTILNPQPLTCVQPEEQSGHDDGIRTIDFLYVGRGNRQKLPNEVVDSVSRYCAHYSTSTYMVGPGISNRFTFAGLRGLTFVEEIHHSKVNTYYRKSKVVLSPYSLEPFGFIHLEALWYGCIVIAASSSAAAEISSILRTNRILLSHSGLEYSHFLNEALHMVPDCSIGEIRKRISQSFGQTAYIKRICALTKSIQFY